jgi:hypothetical protein
MKPPFYFVDEILTGLFWKNLPDSDFYLIIFSWQVLYETGFSGVLQIFHFVEFNLYNRKLLKGLII